MKLKNLIIILGISGLILLCCILGYKHINKEIEEKSRGVITQFLSNYCNNCNFKYDYKMASYNKDNSINVYIKIDSDYFKEYYKFILDKDNNIYVIREVNQDIPSYVKIKSII